MPTYLLAFNPKRWDWDIDEAIASIKSVGYWDMNWSCGTVKTLVVGSRFYLIQLGREPRGLIGTGTITSEPFEAPHWDKSRDDTARTMKIRLEFLSPAPIVRRPELETPPFSGVNWDTQMSGVTIDDGVTDALATLWERRLQDHAAERAHLSSATIAHWRSLWEEAKADAEWVERHRLRDETRRAILPEMLELLTRFLGDELSLEELRETFDLRTRNEWDVFGLKGLSGAMFLNKLAKHLPDHDEVARRLQDCLPLPSNEGDARNKLTAFTAYLTQQIDSGVVTRASIQPNRASFFVSAWWHVQALNEWPVIYQSARKALHLEGLVGKKLPEAEGYLEFRRVFLALCDGLELEPWDVEHLCAWIKAREAASVADEPSVEQGDEDTEEDERVWLVSPGRGASQWDDFYEQGIVAIGWEALGDLSRYEDVEAIRAALQKNQGAGRNPTVQALGCYQFAHEMQVGDTIFAKRGRREIVGYGVIKSAYRHEPERGRFTHVRDVDWKKKGVWEPRDKLLVMKTLTEIGKYPGLVADIRKALEIERPDDDDIDISAPAAPYRLEDACEDLFLSAADIEQALMLLRYKKNVILQGPPGVGKTFFAKRLAYLLLGAKDADHIAQVQFHQSYAYEDFIQGYRPTESGNFARVDGPFLRFCEQALQDQETPYVFVIDEINRGNLSKVFGELLLLIEADKRNKTWATSLTYSNEKDQPFYVPPNLHIIGTMNTADRSLAMLDYALRRRFAFIPMGPAFGTKMFRGELNHLGVERELASRLVERLSALNEHIRSDLNLGDGFCIGHSYFCRVGKGQEADEAWFEQILRTEIEPLLREYWFDNRERADEEVAALLGDD